MNTRPISLSLVTVDEDHSPEDMLKYVIDRWETQLCLEISTATDDFEQSYAIVSPKQESLIVESLDMSNETAKAFLDELLIAVNQLSHDSQPERVWNRALVNDQTHIRTILSHAKRVLCAKSSFDMCSDIEMDDIHKAVHEHLRDWAYTRDGDWFSINVCNGGTWFTCNEQDFLGLNYEIPIPNILRM